jgi:hypothetical protein
MHSYLPEKIKCKNMKGRKVLCISVCWRMDHGGEFGFTLLKRNRPESVLSRVLGAYALRSSSGRKQLA